MCGIQIFVCKTASEWKYNIKVLEHYYHLNLGYDCKVDVDENWNLYKKLCGGNAV